MPLLFIGVVAKAKPEFSKRSEANFAPKFIDIRKLKGKIPVRGIADFSPPQMRRPSPLPEERLQGILPMRGIASHPRDVPGRGRERAVLPVIDRHP
jgi:hypothetical protein